MVDFNLLEHLVKGIPPTIYYIPEFITEAESDYLWKQVYSAPLPKWTQLSHRRLQNWAMVNLGGLPHSKGMVQEPLPQWLNIYCNKISQLGIYHEDRIANHVLVNEYTPGQGILPHQDGPLYTPVVATISLGSHTLLDYYSPIKQEQQDCSYESRKLFSLLLEPRSLVIVADEMYTNQLHGIAEQTTDNITDYIPNISLCKVKSGQTINRTTRVSLTIRHVPKILKLNLRF